MNHDPHAHLDTMLTDLETRLDTLQELADEHASGTGGPDADALPDLLRRRRDQLRRIEEITPELLTALEHCRAGAKLSDARRATVRERFGAVREKLDAVLGRDQEALQRLVAGQARRRAELADLDQARRVHDVYRAPESTSSRYADQRG